MKKKLFLFLFLTEFLMSFGVNAQKAHGYIIKLNQDTIYGTIKLPKFNQTTGAYYLKGIDEEYITHKIKFKNNHGKKYRMFTTDSILGYGFIYHATDYRYKNFLLKYKSILTGENTEYRFLSLIYQGSLKLYLNTKFSDLPSTNNFGIYYPVYYEYYLFDDLRGLVRVEMTDKTKTVRDLLTLFDVNKDFVKEVPQNAHFSDIQIILEKYDYWLQSNHINGRKNNRTKEPQFTSH